MEQSSEGSLTASLQPRFMEHRWGQRVACRAHARLSSKVGNDDGHIRDVSSSGAFIEILLRLPPGAPVTLFVLGNASAERVVEIAAIVVRTACDGLAVEWRDTPSHSICAILGCTVRCEFLGNRPCGAGA